MVGHVLKPDYYSTSRGEKKELRYVSGFCCGEMKSHKWETLQTKSETAI